MRELAVLPSSQPVPEPFDQIARFLRGILHLLPDLAGGIAGGASEIHPDAADLLEPSTEVA